MTGLRQELETHFELIYNNYCFQDSPPETCDSLKRVMEPITQASDCPCSVTDNTWGNDGQGGCCWGGYYNSKNCKPPPSSDGTCTCPDSVDGNQGCYIQTPLPQEK